MTDSPDSKLLDLIRPAIRAMSAYHVPEASGLIKLDAMENPYSWPPELVESWLEELRHVSLNRYPDPTARELTVRLREAMAIPQSAGLVLGNGSDELIQMIMLALGGPERVMLTAEPTFVMYRMIAAFTGMAYVSVPLQADFALDLPAMLEAVRQHQPAVVFIASPNNPTGNLFSEQAVMEVLAASNGLVVIDEAYAPFTDTSYLPLLDQHDNLLVMRTVSKQGLAGLRLGMLTGNRAIVDEINKVRLPYNINVLTQHSAAFALKHRAVLDEQAGIIRRDRQALYEQLGNIPGLQAFPSEANFILFRCAAGQAGHIFTELRERGVLIKNLDSDGPLQDCLRVTVGTAGENRAFIDALQAICA